MNKKIYQAPALLCVTLQAESMLAQSPASISEMTIDTSYSSPTYDSFVKEERPHHDVWQEW